jgi:hypothetical protein
MRAPTDLHLPGFRPPLPKSIFTPLDSNPSLVS